MLTSAGVAWVEFVSDGGNGEVAILVAREALDPARGVAAQIAHGVWFVAGDGFLRLDLP